MIEYRNARFNYAGTIDLEFNHPIYGWLPHTASPDDPEEHTRWLYEAALASGEVTPYVAPVPTPEETRAAFRPLTPREFRDALIDNDIMPDQVTAAIEAIPEAKARAKAINAWEYPTEFIRTDPLIDTISAVFNLTPEKIDEMWKTASG